MLFLIPCFHIGLNMVMVKENLINGYKIKYAAILSTKSAMAIANPKISGSFK